MGRPSKALKRAQNYDRYKDKKITAFRIDIFVIFVVVCFIIVLGYHFMNKYVSSDSTALDNISSKVDQLGNLVDPMNEIGVNSSKDVGYYYDKENIVIVFGKMKFNLDKDIRASELKKLKRLKITVTRDNRGEYVFRYAGELMQKYEKSK